MRSLTILYLFISLSVFGQKQLRTYPSNLKHLPNDFEYEGEIKEAIHWEDSDGGHDVLLTETGIYQSPDALDENSAEIFAYHLLDGEQQWVVNDYIKECPVDLQATFIKETLKVTDLDNDEVAEVWLMYKTSCRGDVSPSTLKIIMYEGNLKYGMRGRTKVKISDKTFEGGEYNFDQAFVNAPKAFKEFARKLWNKNVVERFD